MGKKETLISAGIYLEEKGAVGTPIAGRKKRKKKKSLQGGFGSLENKGAQKEDRKRKKRDAGGERPGS